MRQLNICMIDIILSNLEMPITTTEANRSSMIRMCDLRYRIRKAWQIWQIWYLFTKMWVKIRLTRSASSFHGRLATCLPSIMTADTVPISYIDG